MLISILSILTTASTLTIISVLLDRLVKSGRVGGKRLTQKEIRAYIKANGPGRNRELKLLAIGEMALALVGVVTVMFLAMKTGVVSSWLHGTFAPDSIFFLPSPGVYVLAIITLLPVFLSGLAIFLCLNLLLPEKLQKDYRVMSGNTARAAVLVMTRVALIVWAVATPLIVLSVHDYRAVTATKLISNSFFSLTNHSILLKDVHAATIGCQVITTKGHQPSIQPTITLDTSEGVVRLWGKSDGRLPSSLISSNDIRRLRYTLNEQHIRSDINRSSECEQAVDRTDSLLADQYDALYH